MDKYTRENLIQICIDAIVPYQKWDNRDSYSAQRGIQDIYAALTGGVPYTYTVEDERTIWITFESPTQEQIENFQHINIDSREDYFEWYKNENGDEYEPEMFNSSWTDWLNDGYLGFYMPTRERLNLVNGEDWY